MTNVGLIQLGCPKNQVDAEEMLGALTRSDDCEFVADKRDADVLIVNTCAFIEAAKKESIDAILGAVRLKANGTVKRVVVTGCLAQRYGAELGQEIPEIDAILGIESASKIHNVVFGDASRRLQEPTDLSERYPLIPRSRARAGTPWTAYLKISEGCDHQCTFCSIPSFRGRHRSKPIERIVNEARQLVRDGAREINLVAQDVTAYGMDLYKSLALPDLLYALAGIQEMEWLRLLYCYPTMVTDRLIQAWRDIPQLVPYIDMPLQHADDTVLRAMKRGGNTDHYKRTIAKLRDSIDDLALRTTFIVGFPGEGDEQFDNLERFVAEAAFDRMGVFVYSSEEGTPASQLENVVPRRVAAQRRDRLMLAQNRISHQSNQAWVGRDVNVLVEQYRGTSAVGRSFRDAPEIDGTVSVERCDAPLGTLVSARITESSSYDLKGVLNR